MASWLTRKPGATVRFVHTPELAALPDTGTCGFHVSRAPATNAAASNKTAASATSLPTRMGALQPAPRILVYVVTTARRRRRN